MKTFINKLIGLIAIIFLQSFMLNAQPCTDGILIMNDSYGDGWNGNTLIINGEEYTLEEGSSGSECVDISDCMIITSLEGQWPEEVSWELLTADGGVIIEGGAAYTNIVGVCGDITEGCMDQEAINFNPEANFPIYEMCDYAVLGCTDEDALNFNPEATEDDESCEYPIDCEELTLVSVDGGTWQEEISWSIVDCNNYELVSGGAPFNECMEVPNDATIIMADTYGDGWNGNILSIGDSTFTLETGADGYGVLGNGCGDITEGCTDEDALNFNPEANFSVDSLCEYELICSEEEWMCEDGTACIPATWVCDIDWIDCEDGSDEANCTVLGCMDEDAVNFNPEATEDDESCEYPIDCSSGILIMNDSYGDGWNGNTLIINGEEYTLEEGSSGSECVDISDCMIITSLEGQWPEEVSWELLTADGGVIIEGGASYTNVVGDCGDIIEGCMDQEAINFNPDANFSVNEMCDYAVLGCTDEDALNFNPEATEDDESCEYPIDCSSGILNMSDSYGDGWNGNTLIINSVEYTLAEGSSGSECVDVSDCMIITSIEGSWPEEVSWELLTADGGVILEGGASYTNVVGDCGDIIEGCMDQDALNFNPEATEDDGSCEYESTGCEEGYVEDCNGNCAPEGWILDGICDDGTLAEAYFNCEAFDWDGGDCDDITILYGCTNEDALNFNPDATEDDGSCEYSIDCEATELIISMNDSYGDGWNGNLLTIGDESYTLESGSEGTVTICLEDGTYFVSNGGGSWESEVSWSIGDLLYGGAPYEGELIIGNTSTTGPWSVNNTGSNHTLIVGEDVFFDIMGTSISIGDWLGLFYTNENGDLVCSGAMQWNGSTYAIPVQGDDLTTDEIDGFVAGEEFNWMIWDASENLIWNANATYLEEMPNAGEYVTNGISAVSSVTAIPPIVDQTLDFMEGWNMISTYIVADNMDVADLFSEISEQLVIVKDNMGYAYLPDWGFNGIGDIIIGQGYQIKANNQTTWTIEGTYIDPENNPISLYEGWNMFGYLRLEPANIISVFDDIVDELVIVKDGNGFAYLPEWDFNGIGNLEAGKGYQAKLLSNQTLQYVSNDDSYRLASNSIPHKNVSHYKQVTPTDNNMTIVIQDINWDIIPSKESEIGVFNTEGKLIGAAVYTKPTTVISIWGDDPTSLEKDGAISNEQITFEILDTETDSIMNFVIAEWLEGSDYYEVNAINVASSIVTQSDESEIANFNNKSFVKIINVLGQEVKLANSKIGDILFRVYDDGSVDKFIK